MYFGQFLNFRDNLGGIYGVGVFPGDNDCIDLWGCFKFVLCYGLRQGGGVGDIMNLSIGDQWISDLTYFLVVIVMLLNIIFGIIIDTFSSLRADKNARLVDTEEVCFICGIDKQVFDRASDEPNGFETHIKVDHNMWNYLYYIFMLWEQDRDDDDGLELYVRKAIEADEIIWFPLNKAIRLDHAATEEEETLADMLKQLQQYEDAVNAKVTDFQAEINVYLDQISLATKQSYSTGSTKNGIAKFLREYTANVVVEDGADMGGDLGRIGTPDGLVLDGLGDEGDDDDGALDDNFFSGEAATEDEVTPREEDFQSSNSKPFSAQPFSAPQLDYASNVSDSVGVSTEQYDGELGQAPTFSSNDDIVPFQDGEVLESSDGMINEQIETKQVAPHDQLIDLESCSGEPSPSKILEVESSVQAEDVLDIADQIVDREEV